MKVKHLLALTIISAGLATLIAHASTPQEDIARYTDYIKQNSAHIDMIKTDYAERAIAYAKAGQWENCLRDNAWLKSNRIYTWSSYRGLSEARTKAYLGLGRTDEAVKDMYETFLVGAFPSDLRRLKDFIAKNPQYANYLDLNARADMIQQYSTLEYAKNMWESGNYSNGIRATENGLYMFQVAEKMFLNAGTNIYNLYNFYFTYDKIMEDRYYICTKHPNDPSYDVSGQSKTYFITNGSVACTDVMSQHSLEESLRIADTAAKIAMHNSGYTSYDTRWKQSIKNWNDRLGRTSTPEKVSTPTNVKKYESSYNTNSSSAQTNNNSNPLGNTINTFDNGIKQTDAMIKNINSIKSGLKGLGF